MTQKRPTSTKTSAHQAPSSAKPEKPFEPRKPRQVITFDDKHPRSENGQFVSKNPTKRR